MGPGQAQGSSQRPAPPRPQPSVCPFRLTALYNSQHRTFLCLQLASTFYPQGKRRWQLPHLENGDSQPKGPLRLSEFQDGVILTCPVQTHPLAAPQDSDGRTKRTAYALGAVQLLPTPPGPSGSKPGALTPCILKYNCHTAARQER